VTVARQDPNAPSVATGQAVFANPHDGLRTESGRTDAGLRDHPPTVAGLADDDFAIVR
jgi:hypothetical protein